MQAAALIIAAVGTAASIQQSSAARQDQKKARDAQNAARGEQQAQQNAEAAQARRQQMREARIKRAQVLQASENTGTEGSSGEIGAVGSINTQLGSNIGLSQGNIERSQRIGGFGQEASNFMADAQTHANRAQMIGQVTIFATGALGTYQQQQKKNKAPQPIE